MIDRMRRFLMSTARGSAGLGGPGFGLGWIGAWCACVVALSGACAGEGPARDRLLGHWALAGDARDSSGQGHDARVEGVTFEVPGPGGRPRGAGAFDGRGGRLVVSGTEPLGRAPFTVSLWVRADEGDEDDLGDLVSWWDEQARLGFSLGLRTNSGVTASQANTRQLHFGIDSGSEPRWIEEGRPGGAESVLAFALAVHDGALYAGTCEPALGRAGHVYRYEGPGRWADLGAPDQSNTITALCSHSGSLYAASGKYRLGGSALEESANPNRGGSVYRLEGDGWVSCGTLPETEAIGGLVSFRGQLYASSLYRPAGFFRFEGGTRWTSLPTPGGKRVEAMGVFDGHLWATGYDEGHVYRYDGAEWRDMGPLGDNTQTYSFAIHRGRLHVGTWRSGKVFRLDQDSRWEDLGQLGGELEVMGMMVHNGVLYAGTLPLAEVYRFEGEGRWAKVGRVDHTPDVTYRRAWTMASYGGRLFVAALPSGTVHSLRTGPCTTYDRAFPEGWHHVAAVKGAERLRLYVDGQLVSESEPFDSGAFDLAPRAPLQIGAGPGDFFRGRLADVRVYRGALEEAEIAALAAQRP